MGIFSEALKQLGNPTKYDYSKENRDYAYNLIARDRPAYISLLFPLTCILVYMDFGELNLTESNPWVYFFNIIVSVGLFLPALFFLYKLVIRDVSEFIIEKIVFMILGQPHRVIYRKGWSVLKIPKGERKSIFEHANDEFKISELNFEADNDSWWEQRQNKSLKDGLDSLHDSLKQYEKIKDNSIAFEFNCIYGFYRNLSGGLFLNSIIAWIIVMAYGSKEGGTQSPISQDSGLDNMITFVSQSIYWLLGGAIFTAILAYFARIKQMKRHAHIYLKHCAET